MKTEHHFLGDDASFFVRTAKQPAISQKLDNTRSTLFCDHYKMSGHTIKRCYEIHGYPNRPQGRGRGGYNQSSNRRAYNTWTEHTAQDVQASQIELQPPVLPGLNSEQSKQLY